MGVANVVPKNQFHHDSCGRCKMSYAAPSAATKTHIPECRKTIGNTDVRSLRGSGGALARTESRPAKTANIEAAQRNVAPPMTLPAAIPAATAVKTENKSTLALLSGNAHACRNALRYSGGVCGVRNAGSRALNNSLVFFCSARICRRMGLVPIIANGSTIQAIASTMPNTTIAKYRTPKVPTIISAPDNWFRIRHGQPCA
jgi:hypothetical protein